MAGSFSNIELIIEGRARRQRKASISGQSPLIRNSRINRKQGFVHEEPSGILLLQDTDISDRASV